MRLGMMLFLVVAHLPFAAEASSTLDACFNALGVAEFGAAPPAGLNMSVIINQRTYRWNGQTITATRRGQVNGVVSEVWNRTGGRTDTSIPSQDLEKAKRTLIQSSIYFTPQGVRNASGTNRPLMEAYQACRDLRDIPAPDEANELPRTVTDRNSIGHRAEQALASHASSANRPANTSSSNR